MDKTAMRQLIHHELDLIPSGDQAQQTLRMTYEVRRLHDLNDHDPPQAPGSVFREAVDDVHRHYVGFLPAVTDWGYFGLRPGEYRVPE